MDTDSAQRTACNLTQALSSFLEQKWVIKE